MTEREQVEKAAEIYARKWIAPDDPLDKPFDDMPKYDSDRINRLTGQLTAFALSQRREQREEDAKVAEDYPMIGSGQEAVMPGIIKHEIAAAIRGKD